MVISNTIIAVATDSAALSDNADRLARELEIPRCAMPCSEYSHVLLFNTDSVPPRLELRATYKDAPGPVCVDFVRGALGFRARAGSRGKEPLARAVGLKGAIRPTVLDATAGLGRDAYILATLGCRVSLVERSPIIAALLRDGLNRALADDSTRPIAGRMELHTGDAVAVISHLGELERPDVVYLDPMYPQRNKSALVKKEMRILRTLVGEDMDAPQILTAALGTACKRVVVKRPRLADALPGIAPSHSLVGSTTRFDVYICASSAGSG
jgi:16S rRNA (guanine1516-N2)-methyltransferase